MKKVPLARPPQGGYKTVQPGRGQIAGQGDTMLPDEYRVALEGVLKARSFTSGSLKTFRSRFRALDRELDTQDVCDPIVMLQYRSQLSEGTNAIFQSVWKMLWEALGQGKITEIPRKPPVIYPHPLFADVMLLGAVFGNERLPFMTWDLLEKDFRVTEAEIHAARRCLRWFGGDERLKPEPLTPVVPKDNQLNPMQLWQIEYIINSPTLNAKLKKGYAKETISELIELIVTHAVRLNAKASVLRFACDRAHQINRLTGQIDMRVLRHDLALLKTQEQLFELASNLPQDPEVDTPAMW